jgi:uncharacterized RDD family membrane protein YckC
MSTPNPYAPPRAAVQDVADPGPHDPAGRGTRLVAAILDGIVFAAMVYLPFFIGLAVNGRPLVVGHGHVNAAALYGGGTLLLPLAGLVVWCWLTILFVARDGQSIGKKMLGIKVVRKDGSKASLGRVFLLRNVVNTILAFLPLYGLVDLLLIFGEARQCVHDKIADTIVIRA